MSSCPRCGAENPAEHKFCSTCGMRLIPETPAADTAPGWLQVDDMPAAAAPLLDDSWLSPGARNRADDAAFEAPDWLRRDELETAVAPAVAADAGGAAGVVGPDELPDWLRDIADESRQRLEARAEDTTPAPEGLDASSGSTLAQPALSSSDDIPDWLRDLSQDDSVTDAASGGDVAQPAAGHLANGADDIPPWLLDQPSTTEHSAQTGIVAGDVVDAELVAVEVDIRPGETAAGETGIPAVSGSDSGWSIDDGSSLASARADGEADEAHARVYDVPADSIWSVQPDRPAPDGSTGQQTAVWATPDETARAIVPQPDAFALPSWLEDDDIEVAGAAASRTWTPPSWLEDSDIDSPPVRQQSATWAPPTWLDDDTTLPAAPGYGSRSKSWLDDSGGGVAVAGAAATAVLAQPPARPAEGQSAELLQRLLSEPATGEHAGQAEAVAAPSRGGGTMLIVIIVVLLVMAALVVAFAAPALGFNLF